MKLLGVELVGFACFDRQFVPLRKGINLLVGRNNVGKTALIRGLTALSALPIDDRADLPTDLAGYCHDASTPTFELHILSSIEDSERELIHDAPQDWWVSVLDKGIVRWRFLVAARSNQTNFLECTFENPGVNFMPNRPSVPIIRSSANVISITPNSFLGRNLAGTSISVGTYKNYQNGQSPIFPKEHKYARFLGQFGKVKLVDPHRVVAQRMPLLTVPDLPSSAQNLAQFLQTLQANQRGIYEQIEKFVTQVFPEFRYVNPASEANQVSIQLTEAKTNRKIPLNNCGTGVEQILTLATFVLTTPKPGTVLLDEPHSYLHPVAERALVEFLKEHSEHTYVISTHSAVLMNSVPSDRITPISPPGTSYEQSRSSEQPETSQILFNLGYRNSDALFHDRLILVEGASDKAILPILLLNDGELVDEEIQRTGFPVLDGVGKGFKELQTAIFRYEKLLNTMGRNRQPRLYLFDADRSDEDKTLLGRTKNPVTGESIQFKFLLRLEIENYLLEPEAIAGAIRDERKLLNRETEVSVDTIRSRMDELLQSNDERLFPRGVEEGKDRKKIIKASLALERIYDEYELKYHKERSGMLIAKRINNRNLPEISEITALVKHLFSELPK